MDVLNDGDYDSHSPNPDVDAKFDDASQPSRDINGSDVRCDDGAPIPPYIAEYSSKHDGDTPTSSNVQVYTENHDGGLQEISIKHDGGPESLSDKQDSAIHIDSCSQESRYTPECNAIVDDDTLQSNDVQKNSTKYNGNIYLPNSQQTADMDSPLVVPTPVSERISDDRKMKSNESQCHEDMTSQHSEENNVEECNHNSSVEVSEMAGNGKCIISHLSSSEKEQHAIKCQFTDASNHTPTDKLRSTEFKKLGNGDFIPTENDAEFSHYSFVVPDKAPEDKEEINTEKNALLNPNGDCEISIDVTNESKSLLYRISDSPPPYLILFFAIQDVTVKYIADVVNQREMFVSINTCTLHIMTPNSTFSFTIIFLQCLMSLPSSVKVTVLVSEVMCARDEEWFKAQILSMSLLMSGLCTLLQNTIGVRLPVYQGPISSYVIPLLALLEIPEFACPVRLYGTDTNTTSLVMNTTGYVNGSDVRGVLSEEYFNTVVVPKFLEDFCLWCCMQAGGAYFSWQLVSPQSKLGLAIVSGALIVAGFIHMMIGMAGMVGVLMRFIGPITVIPTMLLIALNVFQITAKFCATHWGVSSLTAIMALFLSLFLDRYQMPIPVWNKEKGFHIIRYPLHQVFAVLFAISFGWAICGIMTAAGAFTDDRNSEEYYARTDFRLDVVSKTPWFVFPYPGKYGFPVFSSGVFVAFMVGSITSIIDSIADYYACARVCRVPSPPVSAVNRGIMVEGFMSMMAGTYGCGHATTTYGGNIGIIGITRVASRRVFQMFACCLIFLAFLGKFASVFVTIPYPVLGGTQIIGFGIFLGLILSNLQYIDLKSTRNLAIIGISILVGLMIPYWSKKSLNIDTGNSEADNLIKMLMTNPNLAGGLLACFLDNTVPGTLEERGMILWRAADFSDGEVALDLVEDATVYEIPSWTRFLRKFKISSRIPIFPTYETSKQKKKN